MNKPNLTVIQGGLSSLTKEGDRDFISAYVTNTRLMGVLAVYASWQITGGDSSVSLHQFFYIDCEEAGLETYKSVTGNNPEDISMIEQAMIGGLGAGKVTLSQRELRGLLCFYKSFNEKHNLPLPQNYQEYSFILEPASPPDENETAALMRKICVDITSDYQTVNYFLMRCFGRDYRGAAYLAHGVFPLELYDNFKMATFCKNVIDEEQTHEDGAVSYLCESLIEMHEQYQTVVSKVTVRNLKVVAFSNCSSFSITTAEAAMMLSKAEYVTVYEVLLSDEDMENNIGELTLTFNTIMSYHDNGRLFMAFKENNDHVDSNIFYLSNDVKGIYFLTDYGQLIVAAYNIKDIRNLESKLKNSPLAPFLMTTAKYEFKEPIAFEFIQSDFEDFEDFLDYIRGM
ncbi:MAG: hypothetical protein GX663_05330 [Clostridiales bacterium]|nr:hypothetical protein [Clostridiales bacterium]